MKAKKSDWVRILKFKYNGPTRSQHSYFRSASAPVSSIGIAFRSMAEKIDPTVKTHEGYHYNCLNGPSFLDQNQPIVCKWVGDMRCFSMPTLDQDLKPRRIIVWDDEALAVAAEFGMTILDQTSGQKYKVAKA